MESNNSNQGIDKMEEETKISNSRKIKIKTLDNQVYSLVVPQNILIKNLKIEIEKATKVPCDKQRLIYKAKMLQDDIELSNYVNEDDQTIHMMAKTAHSQETTTTTTTITTNTNNAQTTQQNRPGQPIGANQPPLGFQPGIAGTSNIIISANGIQMPPIRAGFGGPINLGNLMNNITANFVNPLMGGIPPNTVIAGATTQNQPNNLTSQQQQPQANTNTQHSPQPHQHPHVQPGQPSMHFSMSAQPGIQIQTSSLGGFVPLNPLQQQARPQPQQRPATQQQNPPSGESIGQSADSNRPIELPHRNVHNIGSIVNGLMGPNAGFPGPVLPPTGLPRNSLSLLGGFLYSYQFQLMRLIPFMSRLSDLLQRESQMTNLNDRVLTQHLANEIGKAMDELVVATASSAGLFRLLHMGPNPGDFRITDRVRSNTQPQISTSFINLIPQNQNQVRGQGQGSIQGQQVLQSQTQSIGLTTSQNNPSGSGQQQQQQQQPQQPQQIQATMNIHGLTNLPNTMGIPSNLNGSANAVIGVLVDGTNMNFPGNLGGIIQNVVDMVPNLFGQNLNVQPANEVNQSQGEIATNPQGNVTQQQDNRPLGQQQPNQTMEIEQPQQRQATTTTAITDNQREQVQISSSGAVLVQEINPDRIEIVDETETYYSNRQGDQESMVESQASSQSQSQPQSQDVSASSSTQGGTINDNQMITETPTQQVSKKEEKKQIDQQRLMTLMNTFANPAASNMTLLEAYKLIDQETKEEGLMGLLGVIKVREILGAISTGDFSFLDSQASHIRTAYHNQLALHHNNRNELERKCIKKLVQGFKVPSELSSLVMEGFEPETVALEILEIHIPVIFDVIQNINNNPSEKFSSLFVKKISAMIHELITEVSEGFYDGLNGLEKAYKFRIKSELGIESGLSEILATFSWDFIMRLYKGIKKPQNQIGSSQQQDRVSGTNLPTPSTGNTTMAASTIVDEATERREVEILRELEKVLDDSIDFDIYDKLTLSKNYLKGDLNYNPDKDKML